MVIGILDPKNYDENGKFIGTPPPEVQESEEVQIDLTDEEVEEILRRHEEEEESDEEESPYYELDEDEQALAAFDFSGDPFYGRELDFND